MADRPRQRELAARPLSESRASALAFVEAIDAAAERIAAALTASVPPLPPNVKIANPRDSISPSMRTAVDDLAKRLIGPTEREATAPDATWTGQGLRIGEIITITENGRTSKAVITSVSPSGNVVTFRALLDRVYVTSEELEQYPGVDEPC